MIPVIFFCSRAEESEFKDELYAEFKEKRAAYLAAAEEHAVRRISIKKQAILDRIREIAGRHR